MGLKTNKETKTSRLNCQYVGSFSVKSGDQVMSLSEQNKYVDTKLKNCTKKLLDGIPVVIEVSPDGIQVLAYDEKTVKMVHTLRRVSYATVELSNKLFAYVTRQPNMEVVCHTFLTKRRDHAEGLSAALGKLFKQEFAYTLKRRDKLQAAAQNRGAGRRWAKQQVAEGHDAALKNARNAKTRYADVNQPGKENIVTANGKLQQQQNQILPPSSNDDVNDRNSSGSGGQITDDCKRRSPAIPPGVSATGSPMSTTATVHTSSSRLLHRGHSPTIPPEWEVPFVSPLPRGPKPAQRRCSLEDSAFASPRVDEDQPPALPARSRLSGKSQQLSTPWSSQEEDIAPPLPRRDRIKQTAAPNSPKSGLPPPVLPKRHNSDSSIDLGAFPTVDTRRDFRTERKLSAPTDLIPFSPSGDNSPMVNSAAVLLANVDDAPPPLPRRGRQQLPPEIPEEVAAAEEDDEQRGGKGNETRVSQTLDEEDWYIPGVSREIVTEMLESSDIGSFFVRDSQSRRECYALTMKVLASETNPNGFGNYLIVPNGDGFSLQSFDKIFPDIATLIRHYASCDDGLPCKLVLAGSNPLFQDANGYLAEFMEEENDLYSSLADCTSMFTELNMNVQW